MDRASLPSSFGPPATEDVLGPDPFALSLRESPGLGAGLDVLRTLQADRVARFVP
jgi:hypothetical protein